MRKAGNKKRIMMKVAAPLIENKEWRSL